MAIFFFFLSVGESSVPWEEPEKPLLCFPVQLTGVDFLRSVQMLEQPASGDEPVAVRGTL